MPMEESLANLIFKLLDYLIVYETVDVDGDEPGDGVGDGVGSEHLEQIPNSGFLLHNGSLPTEAQSIVANGLRIAPSFNVHCTQAPRLGYVAQNRS